MKEKEGKREKSTCSRGDYDAVGELTFSTTEYNGQFNRCAGNTGACHQRF